MSQHDIALTVNGRAYRGRVPARLTLVDFLRDELRLTGTHTGCEHGVCGACSILFDGRAMRSCLIFAVQADGAVITTVEGLAPEPGGPTVPSAASSARSMLGEGRRQTTTARRAVGSACESPRCNHPCGAC